MRRPGFKGNILVSNLPREFTGADLAALFDAYGLVLGAMINPVEAGTDRAPRGLVDLAPANAVEEAIRALDGHKIGAHHIKVRKAPEPPPRRPRPPRPGMQGGMRRVAPPPAPAAEEMDVPPPRPPTPPRRPIVERRSLPTRRPRFVDGT